VIDTKLARTTKASMILQLCLYSDLGQVVGASLEHFRIVRSSKRSFTDPARPTSGRGHSHIECSGKPGAIQHDTPGLSMRQVGCRLRPQADPGKAPGWRVSLQ